MMILFLIYTKNIKFYFLNNLYSLRGTFLSRVHGIRYNVFVEQQQAYKNNSCKTLIFFIHTYILSAKNYSNKSTSNFFARLFIK